MMKKAFKFILLQLLIIFIFSLSGCTNSEVDSIDSIEELKNGSYVIGTPNLTYCAEQAPNEFPNASEFRTYGDMTAAYIALQQGKIDALIQDETMARVEIANGVDGVKILSDELDIKTDIAIGINENSTVISENLINHCITTLINDNTISEMWNRWVVNSNYEMPNLEAPSGDIPTIKISTAGNVEPFSFYRNGELTGFDIELSKRLSKLLNANIVFEANPDFTALFASVQTGKTDLMISNLYVTEERKEQMALSIPYLTTHGIAVVRDNSISGYTSLDELKNKKIGLESGSAQFYDQLNKHLPTAEKVSYNNTYDCILALENNRIDAFITDLPNAKYICETSEGVKILPEYLEDDDYGFLLAKNSKYTSDINKIIAQYRATGVLKDLEDKWFTDLTNPNKEMYKQDPNKSYKGTIKAITAALFLPMTYVNDNNEVVGFELELLTKICDELNYKLELLPSVNEIGAVINTLSAGKADIAFNVLSINEERKEVFDMTDSYYNGAAVLVVKNGAQSNKGFFEKIANSFNRTFVVEQRWKMILDGTFMTLIISLSSGILGLLLGFGLCLIRRGKNKPLSKAVKVITKIIQGTPIVVFLMIMYYVVFGKIDISAVLVAILAFGINFAVYASEIMRSGFDTIEKGQIEAARAMGYSRVQTFFKISFPQAAKKFMPVLRGEFISMVKMTSIAGYISVAELTRVGDIIRSRTMEAFFPLIAIALIYFGIAELLTFGLTVLERKLDSKNRPFKMKGGVKDGK